MPIALVRDLTLVPGRKKVWNDVLKYETLGRTGVLYLFCIGSFLVMAFKSDKLFGSTSRLVTYVGRRTFWKWVRVGQTLDLL